MMRRALHPAGGGIRSLLVERYRAHLRGQRQPGRSAPPRFVLEKREERLPDAPPASVIDDGHPLNPGNPRGNEDESARPAGHSIQKRQRNTRFLTPVPPLPTPSGNEQTPPPGATNNLNRHLTLLYRLALDMGSAGDGEELVGVVLDGLLEATPADVGAVLVVKEGRELELLAHRHRDAKAQTYNRVSEYVSREVMQSKEAVLAENVADNRHLRWAKDIVQRQVEDTFGTTLDGFDLNEYALKESVCQTSQRYCYNIHARNAAFKAIYEGIIQALRRFQDEVNEVRAGMECGIRIDGFDDFQVGDSIEAYTIEKVAPKL